MLAAGANRKKAPIRIFCRNESCYSNGSFLPSAFLLLFFTILDVPSEKVCFNQLIMFQLFNI